MFSFTILAGKEDTTSRAVGEWLTFLGTHIPETTNSMGYLELKTP